MKRDGGDFKENRKIANDAAAVQFCLQYTWEYWKWSAEEM